MLLEAVSNVGDHQDGFQTLGGIDDGVDGRCCVDANGTMTLASIILSVPGAMGSFELL